MVEASELNKILLKQFGFEIDVWPIAQFKPYVNNPKRHRHKDLSALETAFKETGFKDFIKYDPVGDSIIDGHGRVAQAMRDNMAALPVLIVRDLDAEKVKLLRLAYNRIPELASYDEEKLVNELAGLKKLNIDFGFLNYAKFDAAIARSALSDVDLAEDRPEAPLFDQGGPLAEGEELVEARPYNDDLGSLGAPTPRKVGGEEMPFQSVADFANTKPPEPKEDFGGMGLADKIFGREPTFGIPNLSLDLQATEAALPFVKWGEISSKRSMTGTWHFYVYDGKLQNIWHNPAALLASNAQNFVEINYSIRNAHSRAYALGQIFRKRQVARWLQSKGRRIFVDLNVGEKHMEDNLLGVPKGWKAFSTRGYNDKLPYIDKCFQVACEVCAVEDQFLAVVYGGGVEVEDYCKQIEAIYIPERMQAITTGGDGLEPKVGAEEYAGIK
jgi:hypothetical protein